MSSISKSSVNAAADSEGIVLAGATGTSAARDSAVSQSASGNAATVGKDAVVLGGSGNRNNLGGEFTASGAGATINITNPDTQSAAVAETFADTVRDIIAARAESTAEAVELAATGDDANQPGTGKSKAGLVLLGFAVLVIGAIIMAFRRKK